MGLKSDSLQTAERKIRKVFRVQPRSPHEPESLLFGSDIYSLVKFLDVLGDQ